MVKNVLCLKHGSKYSADYVNILYNMVSRNLTEFNFYCLTENSHGLNSNINIIELPPGLDGWWYKPYMFSKDLPIEGTILYMDLDVVIAGSLEKLFTYKPNHWCIIRDFTRSMRNDWKRYNSSVIRFEKGQLDMYWQDFKANSREYRKKHFGDQDWLWAVTHQQTPAELWPDEWIQSWKWEVRSSKELTSGARGQRRLTTIENVVPPSDCCITVFHGDPNPEHCLDPWVVDNWR
jgi:hypothetical protein